MYLMKPFLLSILAIVLTAGCAGMRAYQAETAKWQGMADQATTALHVAPVYVAPMAGIQGRYHCESRRLDLGTDQPDRSIRWLLAHEIGHHLDGRCSDAVAHEIAADVAAVRVLQAWGLTEYEAAKEVATMLWSAAKDGRMRGMRGHDACTELVAVLRAYPAVTNPTDGTCAAQLKAGG
jgi:hypothetical protein